MTDQLKVEIGGRIHASLSSLGQAQRKLYRTLRDLGGSARFERISPRMRGRDAAALRAIAGRANRLHGEIFRWDGCEMTISRKLQEG
jgi:hypothetical protein